ncbi:putative transporter [Spirochaetia bacterium]|nr:putative transporter [Spirochaetia bacterium]
MSKPTRLRPVLSFFVVSAITVISLFIIRDIQFGESQDNRYMIYSIRFEYYGMDASEIENLITIPLEEKLGRLNDLHEMRSTVEYGKSITTLFFDRSVDHKTVYLSIRDIVDTLYNILPQAVQKPRIYSAQADKKPVLSIAVTSSDDLNALRRYIDRVLKKELENIEGVAEVIVSGGHIDEIRVEFDPEKVTEIGMDPAVLGNIIQDANVVSPGGTLYTSSHNNILMLNTKISTLEQIKRLPVKAGDEISSLEYFASINIMSREANEILRVNGKECVGIQIISASNANVIKLCQSCKNIINNSELAINGIQILHDKGNFLYNITQNIVLALIQSFILVILIIPLFFKSVRMTLILAAMLPINIIWTAAILYLLGYSLDQNILSGISISLGLIVDSGLVIAMLAEKHLAATDFIKSVHAIINPIVSSVLTTVLVFLPLFFLDNIVPGIRSVSIAISIMLINSLLLSCLFFPSFVFSPKNERPFLPVKIVQKIRSFYIRSSYRTSLLSLKNRNAAVILYCFFGILTFVLFIFSGKNLTLDVQENIIYAVVEYEPEKIGSAIDYELTVLIDSIKKIPGITFVRSEIRNGTAELGIGFDEKVTENKTVANMVFNLAPLVPTGFFYVPDAGGSKNTKLQEIEIAIIGDESDKCRNLAQTGAAALGNMPKTVQTVLNFKNPEKIIRFIPNRDIITNSNISVRNIASTLRWLLFGPVVDKWIQEGSEIDIRVAGRDLAHADLERISNLYIPSPSGGIRLDTLGTLAQSDGTGKIYRRDGKRAAYFTAHLNTASSNKASAYTKSILGNISTEKGYGFVLPRELELLNREYNILFLAFIGSVIGILLLLTGITENFTKALIITSIIPVSCMFPLLIKLIARTPLEMGDITGLVIISGLSVNNAIYISESYKTKVLFKIREKVQCITVTSLTNLASAIPLMLMSRGGFSSALAANIFWGTLGSFAITLLLFPAIWTQFYEKPHFFSGLLSHKSNIEIRQKEF